MDDFSTVSAGLAARVALEKFGFRFSHSLGQNFILDDALIDRILDAADIVAGERVLEIGPGAGVMTRHLLERGAVVTAVELDTSLEPVLRAVLGERETLNLVFGDAMKLDLGTIMGDQPYRVVANLPYYITADVITRLLTMKNAPESVTVLVQKEAAERMMAKGGSKKWCALAATVQYFSRPEAVMELPPECFMPRPHVDSVLLKLMRYAEKPVEARDEAHLLRVIAAAFAMRRKTLANNLCAAFGVERGRAEEWIGAVGLEEKVRGEALSLAELAHLSDVIAGFEEK